MKVGRLATRGGNAMRRSLRAFTLIELLVVMGILSILLGMLLPAMGRARDQARTVQCLSNLRQIGHGILTYAGDYKGVLIPAIILNPDDTTSSVGENGEPVETYATLLVNLKYVPAPAQPKFTNPDSGGDSVFRCPEGINRRHVADDANTTEPTSHVSAYNRYF